MIFDEDWEFLEQHFGNNSSNKWGVGVAIRTIVHAKVQQMRAKGLAAMENNKETSDDNSDDDSA